MGWWKELPYRGDGESKNKKPRRRFVNMKRNRRETIVSMLIVFFYFQFLSVVSSYSVNHPTATTQQKQVVL